MTSRPISTGKPSRISSMKEAERIVAELNEIGSYLKYQAGNPLASRDAAKDGWIRESDLTDAEDSHVSKLLIELSKGGFGENRRALSASILLRYGWSSGLLIGAYLVSKRVPRGANLILRFTPRNAVLASVAIKSCENVLDGEKVSGNELRAALSNELISRATPIVDAHHKWSGFSRKALWSMVTSSWAAQFVHISELLGDPELGLGEADIVLRLDPNVEPAIPDLYMVSAGGRRGVCQMRRLCCLWFKSPKRQFCASCPIIPDDDRLERNRKYVAKSGLPDKQTTKGPSQRART